MALADGEPARAGDTWFRIASHKDHIKNGRAQHGAFKGPAISAPDPAKKRPWDRELSGRLRSMAGSRERVIQHAIAFCDAQTKAGGGTKTFVGVMYASIAELATSYQNQVTTRVVYTPKNPDDTAHADLTFADWNINTREDLEEFYLWLSDQLQVLHYEQRETGRSQLRFFPDAVDTRTLSEKLSDAIRMLTDDIRRATDAIRAFLFRKE
jgi:hypothetical protein